MKAPKNTQEAVDRFGVKTANMSTILPSVLLPAAGTIAARHFAPNNTTMHILGGVLGNVVGQEVRDTVAERQKQMQAAQANESPYGAPYDIDSTMQDIPPWAIQGAHYLQGGKYAAESRWDIPLGEIPGGAVVTEGMKHGLPAAAKTFLGLSAGGVAGGLLGLGLGHGIQKMVSPNHEIRIPGIHMSLADLIGSVGGSIGATNGYRYAKQ